MIAAEFIGTNPLRLVWSERIIAFLCAHCTRSAKITSCGEPVRCCSAGLDFTDNLAQPIVIRAPPSTAVRAPATGPRSSGRSSCGIEYRFDRMVDERVARRDVCAVGIAASR
jgi:hypothetical protein